MLFSVEFALWIFFSMTMIGESICNSSAHNHNDLGCSLSHIALWQIMSIYLQSQNNQTSLARAIGEAHRLYTRMINFRKKDRGYLFQGRFSSCPVQTGEYLYAAVRYVERNPVRAKMVLHPWDFPWSSAAFHAGTIDHDPLVVESPLLSEINAWQDFLSTDSDLCGELKQKSRTGRPCGTDHFFATVERISGRDLRPQSPGRPRNK